jgi:hypothetical protein
MLLMDSDDPVEAKLSTEAHFQNLPLALKLTDEPIDTKLSCEYALLALSVARKLKLEPRLVNIRTEDFDPALHVSRRLKLDPISMAFSTDRDRNALPNLAEPQREREEPTRNILLTLKDDPTLT